PLLASLAEAPPGPVRLHVATVVRENEITLYGFERPDGKALFELLNTVSGIGPKLALALLSAFTPAQAVAAIVEEDVARLASVPGIGRKTAGRLCLELKERLTARGLASGAEPLQQRPSGQAELLSALTNLGFPEKDVLLVLRQLKPEQGPFPERLKQALALLGRS
ncbi:MAG TPA: Holliday junction branch migration protein RuvA, partial [bacterium]|nr:Holliday junction branch migration protein RuvA [bacterium]